ncbi:MAG: metallophosphoesterase [Deltaproteobacteria bacterium]|jgi:predicted MPP superfamily phosphohydrolase|nr:metallophosphoesterase [Deltaproteobacteria bacterium]
MSDRASNAESEPMPLIDLAAAKYKQHYIRNTALLVAGIMIALTAFSVRLTTTEYIVRSSKIAAPVRLALITDLHSCYYGEGQKTLVNAINAAKPDLVLLAGDICDDEISNENTETLLKAIADRYPCYYVSGNHEIWSGEVEAVKEMFRSYGVKVLSGETGSITVNGQTLNICGVDDPDITKYERGSLAFSEQLSAVSAATENGYFTLLMSHRPELVVEYGKYSFDLIVSGHAHGGQWRLPLINAGLISPNQGLFPKYTSGVYQLENSELIVSRGLARESTRLPRIYNRPELVVITLESEKQG